MTRSLHALKNEEGLNEGAFAPVSSPAAAPTAERREERVWLEVIQRALALLVSSVNQTVLCSILELCPILLPALFCFNIQL